MHRAVLELNVQKGGGAHMPRMRRLEQLAIRAGDGCHLDDSARQRLGPLGVVGGQRLDLLDDGFDDGAVRVCSDALHNEALARGRLLPVELREGGDGLLREISSQRDRAVAPPCVRVQLGRKGELILLVDDRALHLLRVMADCRVHIVCNTEDVVYPRPLPTVEARLLGDDETREEAIGARRRLAVLVPTHHHRKAKRRCRVVLQEGVLAQSQASGLGGPVALQVD
mmetsp:Transcript_64678/g.127824  ORF Transcript_64678/g.127824 Transcript_64678/m.127824 type:complete len:226 (-) Transcript_64678:2274-2951(-)